jgi:hypothetical protein
MVYLVDLCYEILIFLWSESVDCDLLGYDTV